MAILQDTIIKDCLITGEAEFFDCDIKLNADENEFIVLKVVNRELRIKDETKETLADLHAKDIEADGFFIGDGSQLVNLPIPNGYQTFEYQLHEDAPRETPIKITRNELNETVVAPLTVEFDNTEIETTGLVALGADLVKVRSKTLTRDIGIVTFVDQDDNNTIKVATIQLHSDNPVGLGPIESTGLTSTESVPLAIESLSENKFIIVINQSNSMVARIGEIDTTSTTINFGPTFTVTNGRIASSISNVSENKFIIFYRGQGNNGRARIFRFDGLSIVQSFPEHTFTGDQPNRIRCFTFEQDQYIVGYADGGNNNFGTVQALTRDPADDTLTSGAKVVFEPSNLNLREFMLSLDRINTNTAVVAYETLVANGSDGAVRTLTVTGNTITLGTEFMFETLPTEDNIRRVDIDRFTSDEFLVFYTVSENNGSGFKVIIKIGYIDASNNLTFSDRNLISSGTNEVGFLALSAVNGTRFLATFERLGQESVGFGGRFKLIDERFKYIGFTEQAGLAGETVEVRLVGQVIDITSQTLIPGRPYNLSDSLELTLESTGRIVGLAVEENKLLLTSNFRVPTGDFT